MNKRRKKCKKCGKHIEKQPVENTESCADTCLQMLDAIGPKSYLTLYVSENETKEEQDASLARIRVALDFSRQPKTVQFRALMEQWNATRMNRELY